MTGTPITMLRHGKVDLALHRVRPADDPATDPAARPLLLLHGLGDASPTSVPAWAADWPGEIAALDFTGHGRSSLPRGGGYTAELLLGDADAALAALTGSDESRSITVVGRGLGAYIALQLAGARAAQVRGAVLADGPGLAGGPSGAASRAVVTLPSAATTPDPYALVELSNDLRPSDYATQFVRLAVAGSELDEPIAVASIFRPEWLDAVAREHGVLHATVPEALATYASA